MKNNQVGLSRKEILEWRKSFREVYPKQYHDALDALCEMALRCVPIVEVKS